MRGRAYHAALRAPLVASGVLVSLQRKGTPVATADQPPALPNDAPTTLPEELPDPFAAVLLCHTPQAVIARAIQRDGAVIGADFDDAFAFELAERVLDALRDDEEAAVDLASFVFDADVRRALAA